MVSSTAFVYPALLQAQPVWYSESGFANSRPHPLTLSSTVADQMSLSQLQASPFQLSTIPVLEEILLLIGIYAAIDISVHLFKFWRCHSKE